MGKNRKASELMVINVLQWHHSTLFHTNSYNYFTCASNSRMDCRLHESGHATRLRSLRHRSQHRRKLHAAMNSIRLIN